MPNHLPIREPVHVDLYVQDCFFQAIAADASAPADSQDSTSATAAPISEDLWASWFQTWLAELHLDLSPIQQYEIGLRLTTNTEIQALNAQYRHKDQPTDVLAFAALEVGYPEPEESRLSDPLYLGDIVISVETAQQQAQQQQQSLQHELVWLAAHGLLHLLGWDHPDDDRLVQMLEQQNVLLQAIGLEPIAIAVSLSDADASHVS